MHSINQAMDYLKNGWQLEVNTSSNLDTLYADHADETVVRAIKLSTEVCQSRKFVYWHFCLSRRLREKKECVHIHIHTQTSTTSKNDCCTTICKHFHRQMANVCRPFVHFCSSHFFGTGGGKHVFVFRCEYVKTRRPILFWTWFITIIWGLIILATNFCHFFSLLFVSQYAEGIGLKIRFG